MSTWISALQLDSHHHGVAARYSTAIVPQIGSTARKLVTLFAWVFCRRARASEEVREIWGEFTVSYFLNRRNLSHVLLLVDSNEAV